jgi:hypothetical protein
MGSRKKTAPAGLVRRCGDPCLRLLAALWRPSVHLALAGSLLAPLAGCTRGYYRKSADKEVSEILANKDKYEAWKIENWHVYPDPRARFAYAGNPDRPAMPPDDPAAYELSPNPQKPPRAGIERQEGSGYLTLIAMWDQMNRARKAEEVAEEKKKIEAEDAPTGVGDDKAKVPLGAESKVGPSTEQKAVEGKEGGPGTGDVQVVSEYAPRDAIAEAKARSLLDITGRPVYLLTLDQAAELAMFNSREHQDQREDLYLAALPVTQERFAFAAQLFAADEVARTYAGAGSSGGSANNWTINNGTGLSKILPTGALLLLNFSNQIAFNMLNPKSFTSVTNLDFSAVQPLLQGGGFAFTLESLTQVERNLLYQIRTYARFRKQLYVEVASNSGGSISGGVFQPSGVLTNNGAGMNSGNPGNLGSTGLIPGVAPAVATNITNGILPPSSPGVLALNPAITPSPSGYLNTMLQKLQVYIDQENIDVLSSILLRFRGLLEGDMVGPLQVQQVEQRLLLGRNSLLTDQQDYITSLDAFKLALGIPMRMFIEMDDTPLQPLIKQYRLARSVIENERAAVAAASALIDPKKAPQVRNDLKRLFQKSATARGTRFAQTIAERWGEWEKLTNKQLDDRLANLQKENQQLLNRQEDLQKENQKLSATESQRLIDLGNQRDLGYLEKTLRQYEAAYVVMGKPKAVDAGGERQRVRVFQSVISNWQKVLVIARDEQWVKVRASWPELPACCLEGVDLVNSNLAEAQTTASRYALEHRFDLMNVRGQVVDAWRQLAVYANALLGVFNVGYNGSLSSLRSGSQPLNIGGNTTTSQLTLNTQLPIVRLRERNNYRACLIAYTRQRRALQEAEDLTVQAVWGEIYNLRLYAEQYKIQKRQLELSYLTIDSSLESLTAPTAPTGGTTIARTAQDGPAALTNQLLNAQASLPTAQNTLLTIWINYLDARLQLYRDLELMPIDTRGIWIDKIKECECAIKGESSKGPDAQSGPGTDKGREGLGMPQKLPEMGNAEELLNPPQSVKPGEMK